MRGAIILAKKKSFFTDFLEHVKQLDYPSRGGVGGDGITGSIILNPHLNTYFHLSDYVEGRRFYGFGDEEDEWGYGNGNGKLSLYYFCEQKEGFFEKHGYPEPTSEGGYRYEYSVACRSETFFCEVLRSLPDSFEILIYDTDGQLFRPDELDPKTIVL